MSTEYKRHDKLAGLHRKLTSAERQQLEENCIKDGRIIDPIVVWGEYIMDGINRLEIAEEHGLEYDVTEVDATSLDEAILWVISHQLGKRNISDFEAQRLRAEQARLVGDTSAVAQQHGVSRRTVQRDVEAQEKRALMSPDVLERCENGEIVHFRSDWKKYGELTDSQRKEVDDKLRRNKGLRLGQALPSRHQKLSASDFTALNESCLPERQKQSISLGSIYADSDSVQKLAALAPEDQELVVDILDDPEIDDLGDAILTLKKGFGKHQPAEGRKLAKVIENTNKTFQKLLSLVEDRRVLDMDSSGYMACRDAIKAAMDRWSEWR